MYGCMALMTERYEEAETFYEAATCAESKSVIAWTMLGNNVTYMFSSVLMVLRMFKGGIQNGALFIYAGC